MPERDRPPPFPPRSQANGLGSRPCGLSFREAQPSGALKKVLLRNRIAMCPLRNVSVYWSLTACLRWAVLPPLEPPKPVSQVLRFNEGLNPLPLRDSVLQDV